MGRAPCCAKVGLNRGPWTLEEDALLAKYIETHGEGCWRNVPRLAGLLRCGKSCRLRWVNYLRPSVKRGNISEDEENLIITLQSLLGNRWSLIAGRMSGRTDNEIKNYWNTHLSKKLKKMGIDPKTHKPLSMPQKTLAKVHRSPENQPCPSVFNSQGSVSECLEETSQNQIDSLGDPLSCYEVQDSRLTSKGACSIEIRSANTKINASGTVSCPKSLTINDCSKSTEQDPSDSLNSAIQWNNVQSVSAVISTWGDGLTSNWSSPSSVLCTDFSKSSKCGSPSSLLSTSSASCKDQLMISSQATPPQMKDIHDQSNLLLKYDRDLPILNFTAGNVGSPSSVILPKYISNANFTMNDTESFEEIDRLNISMNSDHTDQLSFLEEPGVGEFWESINKTEATDCPELENPFIRTDLWDGFGQMISAPDDKSPRTSECVDSFILNFPNHYELELETCSRHMLLPQQYTEDFDENLYFESCSNYEGDNLVYTYELY
ncbi:hypothetical protein O6H91_Y062500 [Diphasiastrum complanatum]|nr:hypothetical protein O6H91_Y062500 [Diphasiastrum complanatum]